MSKELSEAELELAVMDAVSRVDESEAATPRVSRRSSYEFYKRLSEECSDRAAAIRSEMEDDDTEEDEC